jgi:PKD repeat protein
VLQKILVVLVGVFMSLIGAFAPSGSLFASHPATDAGLSLSPGQARDATLATVQSADGTAFAKVGILWVEVDGRRVSDDAWGTGHVDELKFKVGTKDVEGVALAVGDKVVALHPTDVLTVRMFDGEFAYRGLGTPAATLALQGTVKTALVSQGDATGRVLTQSPAPRIPAPAPADGRLAYVVLETGEHVDTVAVQSGGQRFFTQDAGAAPSAPQAGNLLARYVKVDGALVKDYTTGSGSLDTIEFQPAQVPSGSGLVAFNGAPAQVGAEDRVLVKDFVGDYLVYQSGDGLVRLRLDGYAASFGTGTPAQLDLPQAAGGLPHVALHFEPQAPRTSDTVTFHDDSTDDGYVVVREWSFGDGQTSVLSDPTHRYALPGLYEVTLNVTDNDLHQREVTIPVTVRNSDPAPGFGFAPRIVDTQTLVTFTDASDDLDGQVVNWTWDFGDGGHAYVENPAHQFARAGNLTVTLTATDNLGGRASVSSTLFVRDLPPLASFHVAPNSPTTLEPAQLVDDSVDRDGRLVAWAWSFGDGAIASGSAPTHVFRSPGAHTVTLTVTDDMGASDTTTQEVLVLNRPPVADFDWSPKGGNVTVPVTFTSTSHDPDGGIVLTQWDFGDGSNSALGTTVTHAFPHRGPYDVTVHVSDGLAQTSLTRTVTIDDAAPTANMLIGPNPTYRNLTVLFQDISTDLDRDPTVARLWTFGNGNTSTDPFPNQTYHQLGAFPITLAVTDSAGKTSMASTTLTVANRPPAGTISFSPAFPIAGQNVSFTAAGVDPDDPAGGASPISYAWLFSDDGSGSAIPSLTHAFQHPGNYTATLVLTDSEGAQSGRIVARVPVSYAVPLAAFTAAPPLPNQRQNVTFTDHSTSQNTGGITSWDWDFGDGTPHATIPNPTHAYVLGGRTFVVTETVTDTVHQQNHTSQSVYVNGDPKALFLETASTLNPGDSVQFLDRSSDPENLPLTYAWDFGDGNASNAQNPSHVYQIPGVHVARLTVTDSNGATDFTTVPITVLDRAPVAGFHTTPASPTAGQTILFDAFPESSDPDGGTTLTGFAWTFDDRTSGTGEPVSHTYGNSGVYHVGLTVTDGLLTSPTAVKAVRVGANHALTVKIQAELPGSRFAQLADSHYHVTVTFRDAGASPHVYAKGDPALTSAGDDLDFNLSANQWLAGDTVTISISDDRYAAPLQSRTVSLADGDGLAGPLNVKFQLNMPLVPSIHADAGDGYLNVSGMGVPGLPNQTQDPQGDPVYRTMIERFHGAGNVVYRDGYPAAGVPVLVEARYLPLELVAGVRDGQVGSQPILPDNFALGWCRADTPTTDANGDYAWSFQGSQCLASMLGPGVFPVGVWQVRATASYSFATTGVTEPQTIVVDPTGGAMWMTPIGAPP